MHDKIVKCVLAAHNKILQEWKYDKVSSLDMEIRPEMEFNAKQKFHYCLKFRLNLK